MRLAERVSASNQGNKFATFPIHAPKDVPNGIGGTLGVWLTHGTLWIDVNETQSVLSEGEVAITVHLAMSKPILLRRRTQKKRLAVVLDIDSASAETHRWTTHGLDRYSS